VSCLVALALTRLGGDADAGVAQPFTEVLMRSHLRSSRSSCIVIALAALLGWPAAEARAQSACDQSLIASWKAKPLKIGISKAGSAGIANGIDAWVAQTIEDHPELTSDGTASGTYPGFTVAISKGGKLVFTRAYGFSDRSLGQPANPDDLFRLASVSKSLTGIAVLKLIENAADSPSPTISAGTTVGDLANAMAAAGVPVSFADPNFKAATLDQLMRMNAGWENDAVDPYTPPPNTCSPYANYASCDPTPMSWDPIYDPWNVAINGGYASSPPSEEQMFQYMAATKHLKWKPGAVYTYFNFNYVVLDLVLKYLGGYSTPPEAVNALVLEPLNLVGRVKAATITRQDRKVRYYDYYGAPWTENIDNKYAWTDGGTRVPQPYGGFEMYWGQGGYIASAVDLIKFLSSVDGRNETVPILQPSTYNTMVSYVGSKLCPWVPLASNQQVGTACTATNSWACQYCPTSSGLIDTLASASGWTGQAGFWVNGSYDAHHNAVPTGAFEKDGNFPGTSTYMRRHSDDANIAGLVSSGVANGQINFWMTDPTDPGLTSAYETTANGPGFLDDDLTDQYVSMSDWFDDAQWTSTYDAQLKAGNYPFKVQGRWSTQRQTTQWRVAWAPLHPGWGWGATAGSDCSTFQTVASENTTGQLANLQFYLGSDGKYYYQATWVYPPG
jgi:N-acyl-D-amino-acid deacylase